MTDFKVKLPDGTWYGLAGQYTDAFVPRFEGAGASYYRGIDLRLKTHAGWSDYVAPLGYSEYWWPWWESASVETAGPSLLVRAHHGWEQAGAGAPEHRNPLQVTQLLGRVPITETGTFIASTTSTSSPPTGTATTGTRFDEVVWSPSPYSSFIKPVTAHSSTFIGAGDPEPNENVVATNLFQETTFDSSWWFYDPTTVPKFSRHRFVRSARIWGIGDISSSSLPSGTVDLSTVDFTVSVPGVGAWSGNAAAVGVGVPFYFVSDAFPWEPFDTSIRVFVTDAPPPPSPWANYPPTIQIGAFNNVQVEVFDLYLETLSTDGTPDPDRSWPATWSRIT